MIFKNLCTKLIGISLLFVAAQSTFAAQQAPAVNQFVLHNNSNFDIYCRCRSNAEAAANLYVTCVDRLIKAGESVTLPLNRNYSIKTAGTSTFGPYSYFYDVPNPTDLANSDATHSEIRRRYHRDILNLGTLPIIHVTSGVTHGWNFTVGTTRQ